jgi:parallel beta-helix repeat protein
VTVIEGAPAPGGGNGDGAIRCVYLADGAVLSGFTLMQGATRSSGSLIEERNGGGVWCAGPASLVTNCTLTGNTAASSGGGAWSGNLANCMLTGNTATLAGGGASESILNNCLLSGNAAAMGGGADGGLLNNCTLSGNTASVQGGGIRNGAVNNGIVQFNDAPAGANYFGTTFDYSCTSPLPASGTGNLSDDPLFQDRLAGNFRLQSNSPCMNAGDDSTAAGSVDLEGNPRIAGGRVDMGAYEFSGSVPPLIPPEWLLQYGLPVDGSANDLDLDGDGFTTYQEWLSDTNPNDDASYFQIERITAGPPVTIHFLSSVNRVYTLKSALSLTNPVWLDVPGRIQVPGLGGPMTLTDPSPAPGPFYRVLVSLP